MISIRFGKNQGVPAHLYLSGHDSSQLRTHLPNEEQ